MTTQNSGGTVVGRINYPQSVGCVEGLMREVDKLKQEVDKLRDENQYLQREIAKIDDYVADMMGRASGEVRGEEGVS